MKCDGKCAKDECVCASYPPTPECIAKAVDEAVTEWSGMPWDGCQIPAEMQQGALVGMVRDAVWHALCDEGIVPLPAVCGWTTGEVCICTDGTGETVECPHVPGASS